MKGYFTPYGFMDWVGNRYMLFACEQDYHEFVKEAIAQ